MFKMGALRNISQNTERLRLTLQTASPPIRNFRKMIALRAYRTLASKHPPGGNRVGPGMLRALNRWLMVGNMRIEFYSFDTSGEIRVKITDEDGGKASDMSLASFINSSPSAN